MHRIFVSDLHLATVDSLQFRSLCELLTRECERVDTIYLLGDLVEAWVGDDDDGPLASALAHALADASRQCDVAFLHGNRDFLVGETFAKRCDLQLLQGASAIDADTGVAHGDEFCVDDLDYQRLRSTVRSPAWQAEILAKPVAERRQLARALREQSHAANANKPENIMDVNAGEVQRCMAQLGVRWLVHGHTHRPGVHHHDWGVRYVLGDWAHCGWLVRQRDLNPPELECFALADRCET